MAAALAKVAAGQTSLAEVRRVLGDDGLGDDGLGDDGLGDDGLGEDGLGEDGP